MLSNRMNMPSSLESIILEQLRLHRGFTLQDFYKLIYQAVFGVEHLLADETKACRLLHNEFETLADALPAEPFSELIDPEGVIHRLNLRPFKASGGDPDQLFEALLLTRQQVHGTTDRFLHYWHELKGLTVSLHLPIEMDQMKAFESSFDDGDLPLVHHSESYVRMNRPAYRLIAARYLPTLYAK